MKTPRQRWLMAGALVMLVITAPAVWAQSLHVTPNPGQFGMVYIGQSKIQPFTIQNTGGGNVTVTDLQIWNMWLGNEAYFLVTPPNVPYTLASGETMTVIVRFAPPDFSFWDGKLKIYSSSPTTPYIEVALNGFGDYPPPSKVGAFRPTDGTFYLDYNGSGTWEGCGIDRCLRIGMDGDIPLIGDWNGSGTSKVGAFRPTDGTFYLDYNGSGTWEGCGIDRCLQIGMDGDIPLIGDWNGSGTSKVGAFRPGVGFFLDYNGNGIWEGCVVDRCLWVGLSGDIPLIGDWNGSGTSKVGAFRPTDGTFYLDYNGSGTWEGCGIDRCLQIGMDGDIPLIGDWNGSGTSKVGAFRPTDGTFYLDYNGSGTWEGCGIDRCLQIGMDGDIPLIGDWNGSGTSKVGAFRPTDGTFYLDYNGSGTWEGCGIDRCLRIGMDGDTPLVGKW